ncbi:MAG: hypothetical protein LBT47_10355 [Deltaproteobacteria bacterium]|jgi:uncharacterized protein with PhoU and TrkA domain|nr:hypothetical protein [Deltaproteobacteria bacterium]
MDDEIIEKLNKLEKRISNLEKQLELTHGLVAGVYETVKELKKILRLVRHFQRELKK